MLEKLKDIFSAIRRFWRWRLKWIFHNTYKGICNLISYFKVVWEDRNWDFAYTEHLLIVKYKRLYKCLASDDYLVAVDQDTYLQALDICIKILERRRDDFYTWMWDVENSTKEERLKLYAIEERDWNIYCDIVKKYGRRWWS